MIRTRSSMMLASKGQRMTRVFVSYSSEDSYFVDFLIELLKFHHIDVPFDPSALRAGTSFTTAIEQALTSCDCLVVVVSHHSSRSRWMTREVSTFTAINPDRAVIPLVLDADADTNEIYEGLGLIQHLRCYESLLESLRELLRQLGQTLFPVTERRGVADRRSEDRRVPLGDRRKTSIEERLRSGISKAYHQITGKGDLEPLSRASEVGYLARLLADDNSPLLSFDFVDRRSGQQVRPDFATLEAIAFTAWWSNVRKRLTGAAYTIDDIIRDLMDT